MPHPLLHSVADDLKRVDAVMRERLDSDVVLIRSIADYIVGGGGKRLRPALLLLSARACGDPGGHRFVLAAVVEMIHTATLLHDDVVDESSQRRGRATANAAFGNPASVLVGDFLYSRSFQMMVGISSMRVLEILSEATNVIAEGEVLQLMHAGDASLDESAYLEVIRRKTAKLFEASARLGAVLDRPDPVREDAYARYGRHLGSAFQIMDDVLDYTGDAQAIGKNLGDDLAEGKMTLPLIRALAVGSEDDRALIRHAVEGGGRHEDFAPVAAALARTGAIDYAQARARAEAALAAEALAPWAGHQDVGTLLQLAAFAADRPF